MKKQLEFPRYQALLSIDLRCFDLRKADYGVADYFNQLGFLPHILLLHETNLDQVHLHDGKIDETPLDYIWCTQRGMPGCQHWTRRQLRELVEIVHTYGVKFYQGLEAAWQAWPQYGSKAKWPYEHDEVFITLRDGHKTNEEGAIRDAGCINPLVHMKDGSWYEDLLCRDIVRYLKDYDMDGYFSADGMAGLTVPLEQGDYSDDMIRQFSEFADLSVKGNTTKEKADDIWEHYRKEWIHFYTERWIVFYKKLSAALKESGKELATMDAWARGPAESVIDFGFDYRRLHEVGLDYYCLESREENWGRRGHSGLFVWEPGQVVAASAIKAYAPDLTMLWALCTCNAPEHWHAVRDVPIVLERELMTLPLTSVITEEGEWKRAFDGYLAIFGIDLTKLEWKWMRERLDFSFLPEIKRMFGPVLVWSDPVYEHYYEQGERWQISAPVTQLVAAGLPLRAAVNTRNLANAKAEAYVLVDPNGITEEEVSALLKKRKEGADLILIGEIRQERLLKEAGLKEAGKSIESRWWQLNEAFPSTVCDRVVSGESEKNMHLFYYIEDATPYIMSQEKYLVMSRKDYVGEGSVFYLAATREWDTGIWHNEEDTTQSSTSAFTEQMPGILSQGYMKSLIVHTMPDTLELLMAGALKDRSNISVDVDMGQYAAYEREDGSVVVQLENMADFFYTRPTIKTVFEIAGASHFPLKNPSPAGYILDGTTHAHGCSVNVIPDGMIPVILKPGK